MRRIVFFIGALALLGWLVFTLLQSAQPPAIGADVIGLKGTENSAGFARADHVRDWSFPLDHGPHPEFQTEWWYYTGNVETPNGRHFGYQLTFFRRALTPTAAPRQSDWGTNQVYFAHFAITDVADGSHWATERYSRGAAGLAGASGGPYHVWLENWEVTSLDAEGNQVQLRADDSGHAIALTLKADKPAVLNGDQGLSQKSSGQGNASYYYSFTRLATTGTITSGGESYAVSGLSWMDHEFSTTVLGPNAVGWDWFSIQLNDKREVMFFQIRDKDGSVEPLASGTLVEPDGSSRALTRDEVHIQVLDHWTSPESGGNYPARWSVSVPSANLQLTLRPYVADQEMHVSIVYWEGAVQVNGTSNGAPAAGSGYVEMTGYAAGAGSVGLQ
ncbi:MAG: carotenoid 1,2-hydratase [Chloroflexi bacterium]|nr:carotenoid 1,2-hydratase [Chloroflexota bacterium]